MVILSKLADYAVIIATHLAAHPERQMTAAVLAQETALPRATVAKLLKTLAHAGIVAGARGAGGGYRLARDAATISVVQVVSAVDGSMGVTQCTIHDDCKRSAFCSTRPHWHRINIAVSTALGAISLADMANPFGLPPTRLAPPARPTAAP